VASTNEVEAAFFGSISNYREEVKDLKIDVFGKIGIATYYSHISFVQDVGRRRGAAARRWFSSRLKTVGR